MSKALDIIAEIVESNRLARLMHERLTSQEKRVYVDAARAAEGARNQAHHKIIELSKELADAKRGAEEFQNQLIVLRKEHQHLELSFGTAMHDVGKMAVDLKTANRKYEWTLNYTKTLHAENLKLKAELKAAKRKPK